MNKETNLNQQNKKQTQSKKNKKFYETPPVNSVMKQRAQKRYYRAVKQLGIIQQKEKDGIPPKSVNQLMQDLRMAKKYQYIIGRYMRTRAKKISQLDKLNPNQASSALEEPTTMRPFNEIIIDPLCVALASKHNDLCLPISEEWPVIKSHLNGLVTSYIMENKDSGRLPSYDSQEVHRGFRVIKCMDEFSKKFLFECLASIQDKWKQLNLILIPAADIPEEIISPPLGSQEPAPMNDSAETANIKREPDKIPSFARKEFGQTKGNFGNKQFSKNASNFRRNSDFEKPLNYYAAKKTTTIHDISINKPENFPGNLLIKQYMTQHPQTSRNNADFSLQHCSYSSGNSDFDTPRNYDPANENNSFQGQSSDMPEDSSFKQEFPSRSWQADDYLNYDMESQFNKRLPACNDASWRSRERNLDQPPTQRDFKDWRKSSDFNLNSDSNIMQSYRDSSPRCSNPYTNQNRSDRFPTSDETLRRSRQRNPALMSSRNRGRSPDLYANSSSNYTESYQDSQPCYSDNYRNRDDRLPADYEASRRSNERNPVSTHQMLTNSEDWRRSSDLYANSSGSNITPSYQDSQPRYRSPVRNRDDRLPTFYETSRRRSNEFHEQNYETFPNYRSQSDYRNNNNSFSRSEENFFPRDDYEIPPPPPRWRNFDEERNNIVEISRPSSRRSRRTSRSRSRRN